MPGAHSESRTERIWLDIRAEKRIGFSLHRASWITLSILILTVRALRRPKTICNRRLTRTYLSFDRMTPVADCHVEHG